MKNLLKLSSLLLAVMLTLNACTPAQEPDNAFIKGTVEEIQNGKDGYTARIRTADDQVYFATISRVNLTDPAQYRSVEIGDAIEVKGDRWKMEEDEQITVREMKE